MKNLKDVLSEQIVNEARRPLLREIQGEETKDAAYSTLSIEEAKKKYKHGFLSYSQDEECVFMTVFNDAKDIQELLDSDGEDKYSKLTGMKPREFKTIEEELFICLW